MFKAILAIILAYLIGSINFAVIFSSLFMKKDVRELGSGNAGTTNVMRNGGFLPGALTFIFDALKGFVAVYIGQLFFENILADINIKLNGGNKRKKDRVITEIKKQKLLGNS